MTHNHHHAHLPAADGGKALLLATVLTLGLAGVEAGVGLWAGSLALVADARHMVNEAAALGLAAGAAWLARRAPSISTRSSSSAAHCTSTSTGSLLPAIWPSGCAVT